MKRLLVGLVMTVGLVGQAGAEPRNRQDRAGPNTPTAVSSVWVTEGVISSPPAGTVMADSGPLEQTIYTVGLHCSAEAGGTFSLQQISADAGAVWKSQLLVARPSVQWEGLISVGLNQQLRIVAEQVQGDAQCSLYLVN